MPTYVDFPIFKSFLQVVIDGLIRYFADQREIRYSNLFLLGAFEYSFADLGLTASATGCLGTAGFLLAASAFCHCLRAARLVQ